MIPFQQIDERARDLYKELENQGIPLDRPTLESTLFQRQSQLAQLLEEINKEVGFLPNPNRATDWEKIVVAQGGVMPRTSTGAPATDEWAFKQLREDHPVLEKLSEARKVIRSISILESLKQKAESHYMTEGFYGVKPTYKFDPELGRVFAGGEANPMNWTEEVQSLVKFDGYRVFKCDYKSIELRVLQKLSGDQQLKKDMEQDFHTEVAKSIFENLSPTKEERDIAKVVTYATMYGGSEGNVYGPVNDQRRKKAQENGSSDYRKMSKHEAAKLQDRWRRKYWMAYQYLEYLGEAEIQAVSYHDRIKSLMGIDDLAKKKRLAINNPIQNTAGDLAKIGFCNLYEDPRRVDLGIQLVTTVYDSVIFFVKDSVDSALVEQIVREDLESADPDFDLPVEINWGDSWGSSK